MLPSDESHPARNARAKGIAATVQRLRYLFSALLVVLMLGILAGTYARMEAALESTLHTKLRTLLDANVRAARQWLSDQRTIAQSLAEQPRLVQAAKRFVHSADLDQKRRAHEELSSSFRSLREAGFIEEAQLLDLQGRPLLSGAPGVPALEARTAQRVRDHGSTAVMIAKDGSELGQVLALSAIGSKSTPTALVAVLVSRDRMARGIQVARWGRSGETYAFGPQGTFLTEPRFFEQLDAEERSRMQFLRLKSLAQRVKESERQVVVAQYTSYLGQEVVGASTWLHEYGFGIATEVAEEEALGSVSLLRNSFITLVALLAAAVVGFFAMGRWTLSVRERSVLTEKRLDRLARAIQPLSAALENDPSAVLLVDGDGHVVYANAASHRVLSIEGPVIGLHVTEAFASLDTELQDVLDSGQDSIVAHGAETEDETLLVSSRGVKIGGKTHFLYMLRPVTRQVRKNEVENWRKLIRVLTHELNNSLAPIRSLVNSAKKVNQASGGDERLDRILDNVAARTTQVADFLASYRDIARLPQPAPRLVDWPTFIDGLHSQVPFDRLGELPEHPGYFDPVQLERVLLNLLKNAIEAGSPAGQIQVRVDSGPDGSRIDVLDRGNGMSEKVLKQAMLPFFSTKDTGTGVGLALSREIVEAHGGNLVIANREGGGLAVSLTLPNEPIPLSQGSLSRLKALPMP